MQLVFHSETEAKGTSDRLSEEQLSAMVNKPELVKMTDRHRPSGTWAFWYPESEMDKTELETGQEVRLKTRGNSPFICESFPSFFKKYFYISTNLLCVTRTLYMGGYS